MLKTSSWHRASMLVLVAGLFQTLILPSTARAGDGAPQYAIDIQGVPDIDQRRMPGPGILGLPGAGAMYCAPTAATNWMAFIANRGYPEVAPGGPINWNRGGGERYNTMTQVLADMGAGMGTDPTDGTSASGTFIGIMNWLRIPFLDINRECPFTIDQRLTDDLRGPTPEDIGNALTSGGMVCVHLGWYHDVGGWFVRNGGHVVALTQFKGVGPWSGRRYGIGIHDPGSDEANNTQQSPFSTEQYRLSPRDIAIEPIFFSLKHLWQIDGYLSGGDQGMIDGITVIRSRQALVWEQNDQLSIWNMALNSTSNTYQSYTPLPMETMLRSIATVSPTSHRVGYVRQELDATWRMHTTDVSAGDRMLANVALINPRDMLTSRFGTTFILDNFNTLRRIDAVLEVEESSAPAGTHSVAMSVSDASDLIFVLDAQGSVMRAYDYALNPQGTWPMSNIPASITDACRICVSPATDNKWILYPALRQAWEVQLNPGGFTVTQSFLQLPMSTSALSITVDELDRVVIGTTTGALEYERDGNNNWNPVLDSVYAKMPAGRLIGLTTSRTNFDANLHSGPGWDVDVFPDQYAPPIPECSADTNGDGFTDAADLSVMLSQFGDNVAEAGDGADINSDATVNGADLSVLLSDFGCEPPGLPTLDK